MSSSPHGGLNVVGRPQRSQRLNQRDDDRLRYYATLVRIHRGRRRLNDRIAARAGLCDQSGSGLAIARARLAVLRLAAASLFTTAPASLATTALATCICVRS